MYICNNKSIIIILLNVLYPLDTCPSNILFLNLITKYKTNPIIKKINKNGPQVNNIDSND